MTQLTTDFVIRPMRIGDIGDILNLVNRDRLPGQPVTSQDMLSEALAGHSAIHSDWWAELTELSTEVAISDNGLVGVVSSGIRPSDEAGLILWMHAGEDSAVIAALLDHVLARHGDRPIEAFPFATALGIGLEALPVAHRPVTHAALLDRGFTATDLWRYMRTDLLVAGHPHADAQNRQENARRTLQIRENDRVVGEVVVGMPVHDIGVVWWVGLEPHARELDLDKALLGTALAFLARVGAREVILFAPADPDDPSLLDLYEQAGFVEVDRLYGYRRHRLGTA